MSARFVKEERGFAVAQKCARRLWLSSSPCAIGDDTYQAINAVRDELLHVGDYDMPVEDQQLRQVLITHGVPKDLAGELLDQLTNRDHVSKQAGYLYGLALGFVFAR